MLMVADVGEGGAKNCQKSADVVYGWPQIVNISEGPQNFPTETA